MDCSSVVFEVFAQESDDVKIPGYRRSFIQHLYCIGHRRTLCGI